MSNEILSICAYNSEIMGDLSQNEKYAADMHIQSNLGLWTTNDSGARYATICIKGAVKVEGGYVVLADVNLGVLFDIWHTNENGEIQARHAHNAIYIPASSLKPRTKQGLDSFISAAERGNWPSKVVNVSNEAIATLIRDSGTELREFIIRDSSSNDTGARFAGLSFGNEKALGKIVCQEIELETEYNGFNTMWIISQFSFGGDFRFKLLGSGGGSVEGVVADIFDFGDAPAAPAAPVTEVPAAPAAASTRRSFVRA